MKVKKSKSELQASARKASELALNAAWFGAIRLSLQGGSNVSTTQGVSKQLPYQNELSIRIAEAIYSIAAQALVFLMSTAPEVGRAKGFSLAFASVHCQCASCMGGCAAANYVKHS